MSETRTYSQFDIQRYLQQQMSPQEMHEFEKALMDDPFLADALEGYSVSDRALAIKHLQVIERELTGQKQKAKVVPIPVQNTGWWKVAAIVLVIVTGGILFYASYNTTKEQPVAEHKTLNIAPSTIQPDSVGPADKPIAKTYTLSLPQPSKNAALQTAPLLQKATENAAANVAPGYSDTALASVSATQAVSTSPQEFKESAPAAISMLRAAATPKMVFKGTITDKSGEPLPFATIKIDRTDIGTVADANGNFILKAPDSIARVTVHAVGFDTAIAEINSRLPVNKITLKESGLSLADMVVIGYGTRKKQKLSRQKTDTSTGAEPVGGWQNFEQYLHSSIDSLKAADDDIDIDDDVVLEFSIDKQGRPVDIKTQEEANKIIADKAKKILTKGPKWKSKQKDRKIKVVIPF